jgi:hypothetical protein
MSLRGEGPGSMTPRFFRKVALYMLLFICFGWKRCRLNHHSFAQQLKIVSDANNLPLPFATVTNRSRPLLVSANKKGVVNVRAHSGDTLSISYVGYQIVTLVFKGDSIKVIHLQVNQNHLPPVTIRNCRKVMEFKYTNFDEYSQ